MRKIAVVGAGILLLAGCSGGSTETAASPSAAPEITVSDAFILPNGEVAGMFGAVKNGGAEEVKLTGGSAPEVGMVQIHEYVTEGTKETMREIPGGLAVPAGQTVMLEPGGYHVMMMKVQAKWQTGDSVPVTLDFSDGTTVTVEAEVKSREGMDSGMEME